MWNGQQPPQHTGGYYPPPQGAPGGFGFPSPQAPGGGYTPAPTFPGAPGGYAPPPGPPGGPTGYAPPPGPPGAPGSYAPPPGPPGGYVPPGGHGGYAPSYAPPPGPSPNSYGAPPHPGPPTQGGYPGQQYNPQGYGAPAPQRQHYPPPGGAPHMPPVQMQHYGPQVQGANHQTQQPFFQYSQCNGKKKALCIGINYVGQSGELRGCHNDARNLVAFLCRQYGYKMEDIVVLTDDARANPRQTPTRANIIAAMQWLVRGAHPNDSLFFHYSGHGGQTKDKDGDEGDGFDEVIYPMDFERSGHIVDDEMHAIMVKPLPAGCRLTSIFDSCHSGSALDLPYIYSTEGKIKEPNLALEAGQGLVSAATSYMKGDMSGVMSGVTSIFKSATGSQKKADEYARRTRTSPADVISWSGCKDSQTSADTVEAGSATGAMSFAFIQALSTNPQQTYSQLLNSLRGILRAKYSQKPQLSSSHPMDTSIMFIA